jgi:hypothetical protein
MNINSREYEKKNSNLVKNLKRKNYENNKEIFIERARIYEKSEKGKKAKKEYALKNKDKKREYDKKYREEKKEEKSLNGKIYYQNNKQKILESSNEYTKKRRQEDAAFKIMGNLRNRLYYAITKKYKITKHIKTIELLGCSIEELKQYLESQFKEGMSWDNYGINGWHIDHIVPCASFDLTNPEQQKTCFHYTNLQPLWAIDNIKKGCKLNYQI